MIKHIVMWRVRGDSPAEKHEASWIVRRAFEALRGQIPGMSHLEIGVDESAVDYACDVVLYSEFESRAALAAYADHPEHARAKSLVGNLRIERYQVDYVPVASVGKQLSLQANST